MPRLSQPLPGPGGGTGNSVDVTGDASGSSRAPPVNAAEAHRVRRIRNE